MCLQHGDFGAHNALVAGDGAVLFDWRGFIGRPFVDVHLLLQGVTDLKRRRRLARRLIMAAAKDPRDCGFAAH